jgi:hypothetical protein
VRGDEADKNHRGCMMTIVLWVIAGALICIVVSLGQITAFLGRTEEKVVNRYDKQTGFLIDELARVRGAIQQLREDR